MVRWTSCVLAMCAAAGLIGLGVCCKSKMEDAPGSKGAGGTELVPALPPTKAIDPAKTATVTGVVSYAGSLPELTRIRASSDAACAQARPGDFDAGDVLVRDQKVENAFVWVRAGLEEYRFAAPEGPVQVNQKGCMYDPRIFGVRTGQPVEFSNSDATLHNISSKPTQSSGWNFVTPQGAKGSRAFKKAEVPVKVGCDVHPWMRAYAGVVDHPFFRVTGADGRFVLGGLPPGTFSIAVWHERLGIAEQSIVVAAGEAKEIALVLPGSKE